MMKKLNKSGLTLMETLVALLILVMLVLAMDYCTNSAMGVFKEATFTADSATLSGILNTSLADVLRYSEEVEATEDRVTFTNYDYGVRGVYLNISGDVIRMTSPEDDLSRFLVNTGAYPNLKVLDFSVNYNADKDFYKIGYTIQNSEDANLSRHVDYVVRRIETGY